jgi:hypothetical protein
MNREQRRKLKKQTDVDENLSQKIFLFDKIPDKCDTCHEPYDKKDKKMASEWRVVVKHEEEVVRLFCPECYDKAVEVVNNG